MSKSLDPTGGPYLALLPDLLRELGLILSFFLMVLPAPVSASVLCIFCNVWRAWHTFSSFT